VIAYIFMEPLLPCFLSNTKTVVEILAYLSASCFFIFKAFSGYFITNLSVRIACSRQRDPTDKTRDFLTVTLALLKGDLGSVRIHDIQIRINDRPEMQGLNKELWRLPDTKDKETPTKIVWGMKPEQRASSPFITLGPDEETQLAAYCKVGSDEVCKIEAVLAGRPLYRTTKCQWRTSAVSLPLAS
jgi:hypothetical protein